MKKISNFFGFFTPEGSISIKIKLCLPNSDLMNLTIAYFNSTQTPAPSPAITVKQFVARPGKKVNKRLLQFTSNGLNL